MKNRTPLKTVFIGKVAIKKNERRGREEGRQVIGSRKDKVKTIKDTQIIEEDYRDGWKMRWEKKGEHEITRNEEN